MTHGWHEKNSKLFVLKYTKKKKIFFKKKTKLTWGSVGLSYPEKIIKVQSHTHMPLKKKNFFKCFKNISGLPLKSMGKSVYEPIYHSNVAVIQPQINLQFHFTVKLSKLGEIVKPIWLTGNAICKQTWLTGIKNPIWLTSCDTNVKTSFFTFKIKEIKCST